MEESEKDEEWLKKQLQEMDYDKIDNIFAAEYTPERGFYVIDMEGNIKKKDKKGNVQNIGKSKEVEKQNNN